MTETIQYAIYCNNTGVYMKTFKKQKEKERRKNPFSNTTTASIHSSSGQLSPHRTSAFRFHLYYSLLFPCLLGPEWVVLSTILLLGVGGSKSSVFDGLQPHDGPRLHCRTVSGKIDAAPAMEWEHSRAKVSSILTISLALVSMKPQPCLRA